MGGWGWGRMPAPAPEAGKSREKPSVLVLAMSRGQSAHSESLATGAGRARNCPEQSNRGRGEVKGQEDKGDRKTGCLPVLRKALAAGVAWYGGEAWLGRGRKEEPGNGSESPLHANIVSCSHLNRSKVTTPSRSVSRVLKNRNMVSSRTRQHTKLSKSTARSGSE